MEMVYVPGANAHANAGIVRSFADSVCFLSHSFISALEFDLKQKKNHLSYFVSMLENKPKHEREHQERKHMDHFEEREA